jgi:hypothetical protein
MDSTPTCISEPGIIWVFTVLFTADFSPPPAHVFVTSIVPKKRRLLYFLLPTGEQAARLAVLKMFKALKASALQIKPQTLFFDGQARACHHREHCNQDGLRLSKWRQGDEGNIFFVLHKLSTAAFGAN